MKIIIIPDFGSPYSVLLLESLRLMGHQVNTLAPQGLKTLFHAVLRYGKPDIIHLQWQHRLFIGPNYVVSFAKTIWFFLQWFVLRLLGIRFVWTVHNIVNHEHVQIRWELAACRILARCMDAIIVHCESVKSAVAQAYRIPKDQMSVVPHGKPRFLVQTRGAHFVQKRTAHQARYPSDRFRFLYFGYIREYKGVDDLVAAFSDIHNPHLQLIVAGRPASTAMAKKLMTFAQSDSRIMMTLKFIPDQDLPNYITACNIVVLPYRDSLTSGSVSLATAYARPIIAPKVGCLMEFSEQAGFLYSHDDPDGLGNALQMAIKTPLQSMEIAAYQFSQQNPWSKVAAETVEVYRSVVK